MAKHKKQLIWKRKEILLGAVIVAVLLGASAAAAVLKADDKPKTPLVALPLVHNDGKSATGTGAEETPSATPKANDATPSPTPTVNFVDGTTSLTVTLGGNPSSLYSSVNYGIVTPSGSKTITLPLDITAKDVPLSSCTVTYKATYDDDNSVHYTTLAAVAAQNVSLYDGLFDITVDCTGQLPIEMQGRIIDNQPKLCKNFSITNGPVTATDTTQMLSDMVGTWEGCVYTPWVPPYYISLVINADGSYVAHTLENLDGVTYPPLYYGVDGQTGNQFHLQSLDGNGYGSGTIDIYDTTIDDLSLVKPMGNTLSFQFIHIIGSSHYGPISFELNKTN